MRLQDKIAIITGAGSGLGAYTAKAFAEQGASVVIADINKEAGLQTEQEILANDGKAVFIPLDVTSETSWASLVEQTITTFGKLDVLVNSAGIVISKPIEDSSLEDLKKSFALNVEGPFLGIKAVAPAMRQNGGGSIVTIASMSGILGLSRAAPYSTSKGAVRLLCKSAAMDFAKKGDNIRVNIVNPSYVRTPMLESVYSDEQIKSLESFVPLGRLGSLDDVANAIIYLASDESSFVTGFDLNLDGGFTAGN
ncbi:glucose 1-dehydrogenase [Moraxella haemolytica]|uniref:SDR family NAD(P)-dependent oxidoreductase n=1 Tax=Moraxella TaxID=475 RepID=UPI0025435E75|nr:glucose 1-dehydrogenase [Moraxella sp. ZY171148]WII94791.1 glucose 1-dehydrogenase [Moraxella sp. ZY171148]